MAQHPDHWLLDPVFPAHAPLPRLDDETEQLARLEALPSPASRHPSGTFRRALRVDDARDDDTSDERSRKSPSDAPTVRPGSLHALKTA